MSAAECRENRCGHYAAREERTVRQYLQFGHYEGESIIWEGRPRATMIGRGWQQHLRHLRTRPTEFLRYDGDWLIFRSHPTEPVLKDCFVARIRWESA